MALDNSNLHDLQNSITRILLFTTEIKAIESRQYNYLSPTYAIPKNTPNFMNDWAAVSFAQSSFSYQ